MFDWITKPYLEWTAFDTMICYVESFIFIFLSSFILDLKDEIRKKIRKNK